MRLTSRKICFLTLKILPILFALFVLTTNITITLPIAFPTAGLSIVAGFPTVAGLHSPQACFVGNSQAFFDLYGTNAETAYYIAIGY